MALRRRRSIVPAVIALVAGLAGQLDSDTLIEDVGVVLAVVALLVLAVALPGLLVDREDGDPKRSA